LRSTGIRSNILTTSPSERPCPLGCDTHTIRAVNASGQAATGLTWTSSNAGIIAATSFIWLILVKAIGRGLGNVAAHEIAHQYLGRCCAMDADPQTDLAARGAFNAGVCNGSRDPSPYTGYWPQPRILLHWEQPSLVALGQCLSRGWRPNIHAQSCHQ